MLDLIYNQKIIKNVLIVGYGITGKSIDSYLQQFNLNISISSSSDDFLNMNLDTYDLVAVSPGIPLNQEPYKRLFSFKEKITSDIDLFYNATKQKDHKVIAVTGSNGKSTVVTMLNTVLNDLGYKSILVGNIGTPILSLIDNDFEYCVIELSSFQIDLLQISKFDISCVINITQDHLDRYDSYAQYIQSKLNLEKFSEDFFIYDFESKGIKNRLSITIVDNSIYMNGNKLLSIEETKLLGKYNLDNIVVVLTILNKLNLNIFDSIEKIKTFNSLKHRCNNLGKINNIAYINDSKGTNVGATQAAIDSLSNGKNIVLLLGGVAKGGDFTVMQNSLLKGVKSICVYGRDAEYIVHQLPKNMDISICVNMSQAINLAKTKAISGDIILLSPACASFDEFKNYEHRGDEFEKIVNNLKIKG
jgi:UDP-N-acetylmuramoylalanine--D-glutamate ligase